MDTKIHKISLFFLGLSFLFIQYSFAATGQITVTSHDLEQQFCPTSNFSVSGTFILTEDETPWKHVSSSPHCSGGKPAYYYPRIRLPYSSTTWAYLYYTIDDSPESKHGIAKVSSLEWGNDQYNQVGEILDFSFGVDIRNLSPGAHTVEVVFQDLFGVSCLTWWGGYRNSNMSRLGDIIDEKILSFYIPDEPGGECNITESETDEKPNPDTGKRNCRNHKSIGSSVDMANGNLFSDHQVSPNPEIPYSLYYNSRSDRESRFGYGWNDRFDARLLVNSDESVVLVDKDGRETIYTVNADGTFASPAGNHDTLVKEGENYRLLRRGGGFLLFDLDGRPEHIEDRNGNRTTYQYTSDKLVRITDPNGQSLYFTSNNDGLISKITDDSGRTSTFTYDDEANLLTFTNPAGHSWSFTYDDEHNMTGKTDPLERTVQYLYDNSDRLVGSVDSTGNNREVEYVDERITRFTGSDDATGEYTFDENQKMVEKIDPLGNVTEYTWDENLNQTKVTDAAGTASYTYDTYGNLIKIVDKMGHETTYTHNEFGQITSRTDAQSDTTVYQYDARGNLLSRTDPLGNTVNYCYDDRGRVTSITDALERETSFVYDEAGNIVRYTDPAGAVTRMSYDQAGNMISLTDAKEHTTTFTYDILGRMLSITDAKANTTVYQFDVLGNRTAVTDANGNTSRYTYDNKDRVTKVIDALDQVTTLSYTPAGCATCSDTGKNRPASLTDARGQTTAFTYDELGRLIKEVDPLGNAASYKYDATGNLVSRTLPDDTTITYEYDALGRLLAGSYPDGSSTTFSYDAEGNLVSAANQHISYQMKHDALGRLIEITDSRNRTISYSLNAAGSRTRMIMPDGETVDYSYDGAGRLADLDSFCGRFDFSYDSLSRRTGLHYPNGINTSYSYDPRGLLSGIESLDDRGKTVNLFTYNHDKAGNRLSRTSRDRDEDYSYDPTYQLIESVTNKLNRKGQATRSLSREYEYDQVGNRLNQADAKQPTLYNEANQLVEDDSFSYEYDARGNLISKTSKQQGHTEKWLYEYDYEGRLTKVTKTDVGKVREVTSFKYDPFGRRIEKQRQHFSASDTPSQTVIHTYVYDNEDIILEKTTWHNPGHGQYKEENTRYLHGTGIDEPLAFEQNGKVYYYHADGLGSITQITDDRGKVRAAYEYSPFGVITEHNEEGLTNSYAFTGREWDEENGLYYYRARYYDPQAGRFSSEDPIGFNGGDVNLYRYVQNNPVNLVDPKGLAYSPGGEHGVGWGTLLLDTTAHPSMRGPFGGSCGPEGSILATWIPDIFPESCAEHDECYGEQESCQKQCDDNFWIDNFAESGPWPNIVTPTIYWIGVRVGGKSSFDKSQDAEQVSSQ